MNILSCENISLTLNDEPLFENVTFGLEARDHVGLIGNNGTGKSTLLKILDQKLESDTGTVSMTNNKEIMMLGQLIDFDEGDSVRDYLFKGEGSRFTRLREYYKLLEISDKESSHKRLAEITDEMDTDNTWNIESDFLSILSELQLSDVSDRLMATLSGGQRKKVGLARVLCSNPDLLLLDEPTNHLDIETIEWLQKYLAASTMTIIVVTHDRYFLNAVCQKIIELDRSQIYVHPGNYTSYLERRAVRLESMQKEQDRLTTILRRELVWLQRGAKARTGKDTNRKDRISAMQSQQKNVADIEQTNFKSTATRLGKKILEIKHLSKAYGENLLFNDFSFSFTKGMRIGVVGPNGSGKSTLLDIITQHIKADSGTIDTGINTVFGYYDQNGRNIDSSKTVLEYVQDIAERITLCPGQELSASQFLETFSFPAKLHRLPIATLSGGQRRRLYLISRLMKNPNFLVLDEPTNDLDVATMENLENYLDDFQGCTIVVSHDRAFLDNTCDQLLILNNPIIEQYPGNYSNYKNDKDNNNLFFEQNKEKEFEESQEEVKSNKNYRDRSKKKGLNYKEKKEYNSLGKQIEELENLINVLEESFANIAEDEHGTLEQRTKKYSQSKSELETVEERWLILAEKDE
ncbi:MAG: ABC-F family ATP-binding cassette domain-containing protein [Spirochaetaceae bacterium]|nr:ABC-F family ATP-binding cassette domain-containing protein [Spirochaetaceae bacterium]